MSILSMIFAVLCWASMVGCFLCAIYMIAMWVKRHYSTRQTVAGLVGLVIAFVGNGIAALCFFTAYTDIHVNPVFHWSPFLAGMGISALMACSGLLIQYIFKRY